MNLRGQELLIILLIIVLIFGARKLPELARSLGSSAKEFRKGIEDGSKGDPEDEQMTEATESDTAKSEVPDATDS